MLSHGKVPYLSPKVLLPSCTEKNWQMQALLVCHAHTVNQSKLSHNNWSENQGHLKLLWKCKLIKIFMYFIQFLFLYNKDWFSVFFSIYVQGNKLFQHYLWWADYTHLNEVWFLHNFSNRRVLISRWCLLEIKSGNFILSFGEV